MEFVADLWGYLADPEHWTGPAGIPTRLVEHVWMSFLAVTSAAVVAIPLGLWVGHRRKGSLLAVTVVNIGRAVPAFGILALVFIATERLGFIPAYITLVVLSLVPLFVNAVTGVEGVDLDVIDAARGMGLADRQILWRVELPLSLPLVLTGVRLALVDVIATATLAALVAWGGLGRFIIDGFAQRDQGQLVTGALLVAIVAVIADRLVQWAEHRTSVGPRGESPAHP
jgi:osmoprotectant transport system permease protein